MLIETNTALEIKRKSGYFQSVKISYNECENELLSALGQKNNNYKNLLLKEYLQYLNYQWNMFKQICMISKDLELFKQVKEEYCKLFKDNKKIITQLKSKN